MITTRRRRACASGSLLGLTLVGVGCMQTVVLNHDDNGSGGTDGRDGGSSVVCLGDPSSQLSFTQRYPEILIALDRSSSMNTRFGDGTRLGAAQQAVLSLVKTYQGSIIFGYEEFPGSAPGCFGGNGGGCCAGPITVPVLRNQSAITQAINSCAAPGSQCVMSDATPTASALAQALQLFSGASYQSTDRYVLLITDGDPSCSTDGITDPCTQASNDVAALIYPANNVETIVVGVGEQIDTTTTCLEDLANAGGFQRPNGPPDFYAEHDPQSLSSDLTDIIAKMARSACHIELHAPAADPTNVQVFISGKPVLHDPSGQEGWSFDPDSSLNMTFYGSICDTFTLQAPNPGDIKILGCPAAQMR
jgi:hypothetical protein